MSEFMVSVTQYMQTPYAWVQLASAACALVGSLVLAIKTKYSGWGWALFAISNVGWMVFAQANQFWFFLVQQIGFFITSGLGIYMYLIKPSCKEKLQ